MELLFQLVFRKSDGTAYAHSDRKKKVLLLFKGGQDMEDLFQDAGKALDEDNYAQTVKKKED